MLSACSEIVCKVTKKDVIQGDFTLIKAINDRFCVKNVFAYSFFLYLCRENSKTDNRIDIIFHTIIWDF